MNTPGPEFVRGVSSPGQLPFSERLVVFDYKPTKAERRELRTHWAIAHGVDPAYGFLEPWIEAVDWPSHYVSVWHATEFFGRPRFDANGIELFTQMKVAFFWGRQALVEHLRPWFRDEDNNLIQRQHAILILQGAQLSNDDPLPDARLLVTYTG